MVVILEIKDRYVYFTFEKIFGISHGQPCFTSFCEVIPNDYIISVNGNSCLAGLALDAIKIVERY